MSSSLTYKVFVKSSRNNIHVTVTTPCNSKTLLTLSGGLFTKDKSSRNSISVIAELVLHISSFFRQYNVYSPLIILYFDGVRQKVRVVKEFRESGFIIQEIFYINRRAFNGCRLKKQRRLLMLK
jgi:ribosomal protein S11